MKQVIEPSAGVPVSGRTSTYFVRVGPCPSNVRSPPFSSVHRTSQAAVAIGKELREYLDQAPGRPVKRIGVVLCGGNQDLSKIPWLQK
jgi:hypothetical protein